VDYEDFRREYLAGGLRRDMLAACPIEQFQQWLQQAVAAQLRDPTAMVLATVDTEGHPWQRIVLLKEVSTDGFVFYTNYGSAKARAMAANARVSLHFPWNSIDRQVIVGGEVEKLSVAASTRYFLSRPRESQLAAWASQQSRPISARAMLEQEFANMKAKFSRGDVPMPDFWGGYRVVPERIEFWQGGAHRLHDRFEYRRQRDGGWAIEQLQP
jgi:pyridoxamine 5'-phosphate oxidase